MIRNMFSYDSDQFLYQHIKTNFIFVCVLVNGFDAKMIEQNYFQAPNKCMINSS